MDACDSKLGKFGLTGINCIFLVLSRYKISPSPSSPCFFSFFFFSSSPIVSQKQVAALSVKINLASPSIPFIFTNNNVDSKHNLPHPILLLVIKDCLTSFCLISITVNLTQNSHPLYLSSPSRRVSPVHQNHLLLHFQPITNPTTYTKEEPKRTHNGSPSSSSRLRPHPGHLLSSTP